jgi:uncharacterized protein YbjT (DUF2867 family)
MPHKLALTQPTGKLGAATLRALLSHSLLPPSALVLSTSSQPDDPRLKEYADKGITIKHAIYDSSSSMTSAWSGCTHLFLVSSPAINLDFHEAPSGEGREKHHIAAIKAAKEAGIEHIYYTSLAFGSNSKAGVMVAHNRTEKFLEEYTASGAEGQGMTYTIIREGLYNESWPLYFGQYGIESGKLDSRDEVPVGGDSKISWTGIDDLGLANALVLADESEKWAGKMFYLSAGKSNARSLKDIAGIVSEIRGKKVGAKVVEKEEYERYCMEERGQDEGFAKWWSKTYVALRDVECDISDDTLENLLAKKGRKPKTLEETMKEMIIV